MNDDIDKILMILKYDMHLSKQLLKSQGITVEQLVDRWKDNNPELKSTWYYGFFTTTLVDFMNEDEQDGESMDRILRIHDLETTPTINKIFTII